jgi:uncharacterized protein YbjT (DUF2867 family)
MIVITTPTGDIGHQLVTDVLAAGSEPVRVIVRDAGRLPAAVRDAVEVIEGSHGEPEVVDRAFAGADSVFWVVPPEMGVESARAHYLDFTRPAAEAFMRHGVQRVVVVSALGRGVPGDAGLVTASLESVDMIGATGVSYRSLACASFMDNFLRQVDPIRGQGVFFSTISGSLKAPTCATRDIAAVAARLLLDHSWSGQAEVPVLGPEDLSSEDIAQILTEVLDKPVRFQQIPIEGFAAQMRERGASEGDVKGMIEMFIAKDNGLDNHVQRTPELSTPTTFRQWAEEVLKPAIEA